MGPQWVEHMAMKLRYVLGVPTPFFIFMMGVLGLLIVLLLCGGL